MLRKFRRATTTAIAATMILVGTLASPAWASPRNVTPLSAHQLQSLASVVNTMRGQIAALQRSNAQLRRELRTLDGGNDRLLSGFSRAGHTLVLSGMNLQLKSGTGATASKPNGLGNLIIGYNESPGAQTGSANLVMGSHNSFTSYAGIVDGENNVLDAPFASVLSGRYNEASDPFSLLAAGCDNTTGSATARGESGCGGGGEEAILGGLGNQSTGLASSIVGGDSNEATGSGASVVGGCGNVAGTGSPGLPCDTYSDSVLGGFDNVAAGVETTVSGGTENNAIGTESTVAGGMSNVASGEVSEVSGGVSNTVGGPYSTVAGGFYNAVFGMEDAIAGGASETLVSGTVRDTKVGGEPLIGP